MIKWEQNNEEFSLENMNDPGHKRLRQEKWRCYSNSNSFFTEPKFAQACRELNVEVCLFPRAYVGGQLLSENGPSTWVRHSG